MKRTSVVGIVSNQASAEAIMTLLQREGVGPGNVSALMPDHGFEILGANDATSDDGSVGAWSPEDVRDAFEWLIDAQWTLRAVGRCVGAGPLFETVPKREESPGINSVGATLVAVGMPELEAEKYAGRVANGNILFFVFVANSAEEWTARSLLRAGGAVDVNTWPSHD
jgi:hypothetical protein